MTPQVGQLSFIANRLFSGGVRMCFLEERCVYFSWVNALSCVYDFLALCWCTYISFYFLFGVLHFVLAASVNMFSSV